MKILLDSEIFGKPLTKYEKEERELKRKLKDQEVESELSKSKSGEVYEVGSREIRMCEEVKEYELPKYNKSELEGSVMSKWYKK